MSRYCYFAGHAAASPAHDPLKHVPRAHTKCACAVLKNEPQMSQKLRIYHPNGIPDSSISTAGPSTVEPNAAESSTAEASTGETSTGEASTGEASTGEASTGEASTAETRGFPWTPFPADLWRIVLDVLDNQVIPLDDDLSEDDNEVERESAVSRDFGAISLVSRRLHQIAEPYLYNKFVWIPHINIESPSISLLGGRDMKVLAKARRKKRLEYPWRSGPPPFLLLRTLIHQPTLARHCKTVKLYAASPERGLFWDIFEAREGAFTVKEFGVCEKTIARLSYDSRNNWLDALYKGRLDVILGLLLLRFSRSPQLTTIDLRIRDGSTVGNPIFEALTIPATVQRPFSSVTSITFSMDKCYDEDSFWWLEDHHVEDEFDVDTQVGKLLKFPQLSSLALNFCSPNPTWPNVLPISTSLKRLSLKFGSLRERMLAQLIEATPMLEELECDLAYDRFAGGQMDCSILSRSLESIKNTLTSLSITIVLLWKRERDAQPWDILEPMGSMKDFKKLRYLDIPLITLVPTIPQHAPSLSKYALEALLPDSLHQFKTNRHPASPDKHTRKTAEKLVREYVDKNAGMKERLLAMPKAWSNITFEERVGRYVIYGVNEYYDW
ncbi:hypothetical protein BDZ45DRAFT_179019 [Acephala macrosclerotiorum]|nr:hypothetical protein BDZ45DRAFT_179019 [Acephala macrosclerotiorum]